MQENETLQIQTNEQMIDLLTAQSLTTSFILHSCSDHTKKILIILAIFEIRLCIFLTIDQITTSKYTREIFEVIQRKDFSTVQIRNYFPLVVHAVIS